MFGRVRLRLLAWNLVIFGLVLALFSVIIYFSFTRTLFNEVDRNLTASGNDVASLIRAFGPPGLSLSPSGYEGGLFYLVITNDGTVLANPQKIVVSTLKLPGQVAGQAPFATGELGAIPVRVYVRPLTDIGMPSAYLLAGQSLVPEVSSLNSLFQVLVFGSGAGLLLALVGAFVLTGRSLAPIRRAFKRQQEFSADAAHELRTPLTVLHAATDVLDQHRDEPLSANAELFSDVRHEIVRMERLTNDLLTLARSDLGELNLAVGDVDLAALVNGLARRLRPLAEEKQLELRSSTDVTGAIVEADPDRLEQTVLILADNAIKHTPPGGVVGLAVFKQGNYVLVSVSDTGEGIPAEHLRRLFDRFYQANRSRSGGGAGLGLAIARSLVEAHGGQIGIASAPGKGTTVSLRLPQVNRRQGLPQRLGKVTARLRGRATP